MLAYVALLVVGLVVLAKAADLFVVGAARLAVTLRMSPLVIGAVVVGFGTGMPELLVSGLAAREGDLDIAVGNVIGSNLANLTLVLGVAGLLVQPVVSSRILRREAPLALAAVALFSILVQGGLQRWDGVVLLVALVAAVIVMLRVSKQEPGSVTAEPELEGELEEFVEHGAEHQLVEVARAPNRPDVLRTVFGLAGTILGAQLLVTAARNIADELGLSGGFVGVTLVAIGTSLPELVTAVQAARRNETALLIGNVLGSNIFNSLGVGGAVALLGPGLLEDTNLATVGVIVMLVIATLTWVFLAIGRRLHRWESVALLALYVATLPLLA